MPSYEAQAALIKYVYESHGLDYDSTQYVEAHVSEPCHVHYADYR
jgi:zearalenone synthase (highly reducing iterative type I polyketide synthase)